VATDKAVRRKYCGRIQAVSNGEEYFCNSVREIFNIKKTKDNQSSKRTAQALIHINGIEKLSYHFNRFGI
jgi:hypothetical protein